LLNDKSKKRPPGQCASRNTSGIGAESTRDGDGKNGKWPTWMLNRKAGEVSPSADWLTNAWRTSVPGGWS